MRALRPSSTCYIRWAFKDSKESVKCALFGARFN